MQEQRRATWRYNIICMPFLHLYIIYTLFASLRLHQCRPKPVKCNDFGVGFWDLNRRSRSSTSRWLEQHIYPQVFAWPDVTVARGLWTAPCSQQLIWNRLCVPVSTCFSTSMTNNTAASVKVTKLSTSGDLSDELKQMNCSRNTREPKICRLSSAAQLTQSSRKCLSEDIWLAAG